MKSALQEDVRCEFSRGAQLAQELIDTILNLETKQNLLVSFAQHFFSFPRVDFSQVCVEFVQLMTSIAAQFQQLVESQIDLLTYDFILAQFFNIVCGKIDLGALGACIAKTETFYELLILRYI